MTRISRRRLLALGGATLAGSALWPSTPANAQDAWGGDRSANGWPVLDTAEVFLIEGSELSVALAPAAAPVLLHVIRRYLYEVESQVQPGEITGHTTDRRVATPFQSAYLSGSGIAIRPLHHPPGARDTYFPQETAVIRDIVAESAGLVAWGGDLDPVTASHFHLTAPPDSPRYRTLLSRVLGWSDSPAEGAGAVTAFDG